MVRKAKKNKVKKIKKAARRHLKVSLERLAIHLGKIVDNSSVKDIQEAGLNVALAFAGYDAFKNWKGALLGPVSLKLATAPGGTPPVSQIAGIAGLSMLGLAMVTPWEGPLEPIAPPIIPSGTRESCEADCERLYGQFPALVSKCQYECRKVYRAL